MGKRRKKWSYILLLILLFIGAVAVPCTVITGYANRLIADKIHSNNKNFLYATYMSVDSELNGAYARVNSLVEQNAGDYYTLLKAENADQAEITLALYRFYDKFKAAQLNNTFFENTFVYFPAADLVVTSEGSYEAEFFFQKKMIFEGYGEEYFAELTEKQFSSMFCPAVSILTQTQNTEPEISHTSVIPVAVRPSTVTAKEGIFVFLINEEKMNSFFERLNTDRSSFIYLQDTKTGEILNSPSEIAYETQLDLAGQSYKGKSQSMELKVNGENYQLSWKNSAVNRIRYICVEPELLITRQIRKFLYLTVTVTAAVGFLILCLFGMYSKYLHKNIGVMLGRLNQAASGGVETAEKQVFLNNIPELKAAVEVLCAQHENNRPYLIHSFLGRSLQDNLTEEELSHFEGEFSEFRKGNFFRLYLWKFSGSDEKSEKELLSDDYLKKLETCGSLIFLQKERLLALFLAAETENELKELEKKIASLGYVPSKETMDTLCGRSVLFRDIHENYRCSHQVQNLLEYYGIRERKECYDMEDMLTAEELPLEQEKKKRVIQLLKTSPEEAFSCVSEILKQMKERNVSFYQYRSVVKELLFMLQESMYEQKIPFASELMEQTEKMIVPEKLETLCLEAYQKVPDLRGRNVSVNEAEQTLLQYIDENLAEINLTMLSEATGMNQNYLSQYFKKHFGVSFLDYVTEKKMQKARELLINTDYTCKAIGEMLGYSAQNVFIRAFKKSEQLTPAEYRQKNRKEA